MTPDVGSLRTLSEAATPWPDGEQLIQALLRLEATLAEPMMPEPLDVERLAQALWNTQDERLHGGADGFGLGSNEADAGCIAAEYARLAAATPESRADG